MAVPEGFEKLAVIGIAHKGDYDPNTTYSVLNAVYYDGSTWVALRDDPAGEPTDDKANWQYLAKGFLESLLSAVNAVDTSGLLGTSGAEVSAQGLLDVIADKVATKLIPYTNLVNNGATTEVGKFALDAVMGKKLSDQVADLNADLSIKEISASVNVTTSNAIAERATAKRCGRLLSVSVTFRTSELISTGGSITGQLVGIPLLGGSAPLSGFYGSTALVCFMPNNTTLSIRVIGAALPSGAQFEVSGVALLR